jgi:hypothetical protein
VGKQYLGYKVVDYPDTPEVIDAALDTIPGAASAPLEIVAQLADHVVGISVGDAIGSILGVFVGPAGQEVLALQIGGPFDPFQPCFILKGSRVSIRNMAAPSLNLGNLGLSFLGEL